MVPHPKSRAVSLLALSTAGSISCMLLALAVGTVWISPWSLFSALSSLNSPEPSLEQAIILSLRLPRVLLAFAAGAAFSVSGAALQAVLKNPLASPFTLGVSAGASLGAGSVILFGLSSSLAAASGILSLASAPLAGFLMAMLTVGILLRFSRAVDPDLSGTTVILAGMVISLFLNALLTLATALSRESVQRLVFWQMGSFALKGPYAVVVVWVTALAGISLLSLFHRELDILTFGDDEAVSLGVNSGRMRVILIAISAVMTGTAVSFVGVIGFVDLAVPHAVRRIAGPAHRLLIPLCALWGGTLMVAADLIARIVLAPTELPVGAVTALLGAPFFARLWMHAGRRDR